MSRILGLYASAGVALLGLSSYLLTPYRQSVQFDVPTPSPRSTGLRNSELMSENPHRIGTQDFSANAGHGQLPTGPIATPRAALAANGGNVDFTVSRTAIPLALQDPSPDLALNEHQAAALDQLAQSFMDTIGDEVEDPNDPAYRRRWQAAQAAADEQYKVWLGGDAWQAQQLQANTKGDRPAAVR